MGYSMTYCGILCTLSPTVEYCDISKKSIFLSPTVEFAIYHYFHYNTVRGREMSDKTRNE